MRATTLSQLENQEKANKMVKTMGKKTKKDKEEYQQYFYSQDKVGKMLVSMNWKVK